MPWVTQQGRGQKTFTPRLMVRLGLKHTSPLSKGCIYQPRRRPRIHTILYFLSFYVLPKKGRLADWEQLLWDGLF